MTNETIVAVYDTEDHAAAAVRDLEDAGVPSSAVTQHAKNSMTSGPTTTAVPTRAPRLLGELVRGRACECA